MILVNYPEPDFRIKKENEKEYIFDSMRKQWLVLTEEEWVRQNFIQCLIQNYKYPSTMIAVEREIQLGELKKRFDILVYNKEHKPWMLVECKAPSVVLDENTLQQLLRYNISVPVSFLIITNGSFTMGWQKTGVELIEITQIPFMK